MSELRYRYRHTSRGACLRALLPVANIAGRNQNAGFRRRLADIEQAISGALLLAEKI